MMSDSCGLVLLLLIVLTWQVWIWWRQRNQNRPAVAVQIQRLLKPRTPNNCPSCCLQVASITPQQTMKSRWQFMTLVSHTQ
jgi:hypothetical protein